MLSGIKIQCPDWPFGPPLGEPVEGEFRLAEGVATFGIGEVQAPEAPVWPMFFITMLKSKIFMTPSLFKSAFSFQLADPELVPTTFLAME